MSFSGEVKEELSRHMPAARHCQIAGIAAVFHMCGKIIPGNNGAFVLKLQTDNLTVARKYFMLIRKTFHVREEVCVRASGEGFRNRVYSVAVMDKEKVVEILQAIKVLGTDYHVDGVSLVNRLVVQNVCCKRAFIRGAFLSAGSVSNPEKSYHFEIVLPTRVQAEQLKELICSFEIDAKIVMRKKNYVVYVKEGSQIVDLLNVMEAHVALMNLENVRIEKEIRNCVNRQVNCEAANIHKTVQAATRQLEDIKYIRDTVGLSELSQGLEDIARLRLEQPDASLKELGALLCPPLGRSGVNHRLRKLGEIAERLREQKEDS